MKKTLLYFLLCCPLLADSLTGTCKRVVDGDTFILNDDTTVQIWGIDAPELKQNFGQEARKAKKGLWADENPVKPYLFCKGGKQQAAEPVADEVICHYVQDGDTFKLPDNKTRVRLWGIDAPEKGQAYADESRSRLKELCEGKAVRLEIKDTDQYGRKVAIVWIGKKNINLQMVKEGLAWHYAYFAPDAKDLAAAEKAARKARKGLWKDKNPINPYDFRKKNR